MPQHLKDPYIEMLFQSRIQMIDPIIMNPDEINDILESCYPLYEQLNERDH